MERVETSSQIKKDKNKKSNAGTTPRGGFGKSNVLNKRTNVPHDSSDTEDEDAEDEVKPAQPAKKKQLVNKDAIMHKIKDQITNS